VTIASPEMLLDQLCWRTTSY